MDRNWIVLTRPDRFSFSVLIAAIESLEPADNLEGPPGARSRIQISGNPRFVVEPPDQILTMIANAQNQT